MNQVTIVTDGAGFIGSHLVGQLIKSGQSVRVIERKRPTPPPVIHPV